MPEYAVEYHGWGHTETVTVTARSPAQARYVAWLDISEPTCIEFKEFLTKWVRSVRKTKSSTRYDYVRENYGLDVGVGDRVVAGGRLGTVAEPAGSNPRHSYVYVLTDSGSVGPYHPNEVRHA